MPAFTCLYVRVHMGIHRMPDIGVYNYPPSYFYFSHWSMELSSAKRSHTGLVLLPDFLWGCFVSAESGINRVTAATTGFYAGSEGLISDPYSCIESSFTFKMSPQPFSLYYLSFFPPSSLPPLFSSFLFLSSFDSLPTIVYLSLYYH